MRAIGGAAVVNRLAHFYLEKRGARVTAASRQIARKRDSYSVGCAGLVGAAARLRTRHRIGSGHQRGLPHGARFAPPCPTANPARTAASAAW